jgi:hypothetical protein
MIGTPARSRTVIHNNQIKETPMNTTNLQDEREVDRAADHFVTQLVGLDH